MDTAYAPPVATTAADLLAGAGAGLPGHEGRHEAEVLLLHVLGRERAWLFAHGDSPVEAMQRQRFLALVARRAAGEPVAYLTGRRGFWTLDLEVTPATLVPRAETELLVEQALELLPAGEGREVLDLGTGSGAIALALASERPLARVTATDASAAALEVASRNAAAHGLGRVRLVQGNWFAPLAGQRFDLVVSNPPYIAAGDPHLARGDLRFEPATALASGPQGLDDIALIAAQAPAHLHAGGWLLLEHGHDQGAAVRAVLQATGLGEVATCQDLEGRDRVTRGRR